MIYTSYFANLRNIDSSIVPIAICQYPPQYWKGLVYKRVAPTYEIMSLAKSGKVKMFKDEYEEFILTMDIDYIVEELYDMADSDDIVLVCFEKTGDVCHRHVLADILRMNGYPVKEWGED